MSSDWKTCVVFWLAYLLLILDYSNGQGQGQSQGHGQGQGHAHFDCEYIVNGDIEGKHYYCLYIESHVIWSFDWHICIWP